MKQVFNATLFYFDFSLDWNDWKAEKKLIVLLDH